MVYANYEIEMPVKNDEYEYLDVEFRANVYKENDSIGSYEYWGSKEYDHRPDYLAVDDVQWNKEKFTEEQNAYIDKYLTDNYELVENAILQTIHF